MSDVSCAHRGRPISRSATPADPRHGPAASSTRASTPGVPSVTMASRARPVPGCGPPCSLPCAARLVVSSEPVAAPAGSAATAASAPAEPGRRHCGSSVFARGHARARVCLCAYASWLAISPVAARQPGAARQLPGRTRHRRPRVERTRDNRGRIRVAGCRPLPGCHLRAAAGASSRSANRARCPPVPDRTPWAWGGRTPPLPGRYRESTAPGPAMEPPVQLRSRAAKPEVGEVRGDGGACGA